VYYSNRNCLLEHPLIIFAARGHMKISRLHVGIATTCIWFVIASITIYLSPTTFFSLKPNEMGDLMAGVFAPVAFFWLILGYLQQGEELRLNTEALKTQADELHQSVKLQEHLVQVAKAQVGVMSLSNKFQMKQARDAEDAHFVCTKGSVTRFTEDKHRIEIVSLNDGRAVTGVQLRRLAGDGFYIPTQQDSVPTKGQLTYIEDFGTTDHLMDAMQGANLTIRYLPQSLDERLASFKGYLDPDFIDYLREDKNPANRDRSSWPYRVLRIGEGAGADII
jgi:hypothetical protein